MHSTQESPATSSLWLYSPNWRIKLVIRILVVGRLVSESGWRMRVVRVWSILELPFSGVGGLNPMRLVVASIVIVESRIPHLSPLCPVARVAWIIVGARRNLRGTRGPGETSLGREYAYFGVVVSLL